MLPSVIDIRVLSAVVLLCSISLVAQEEGPQLSADSPIEFNTETRTLEAAGNARLEDSNLLIEADSMRFFQAEGRVVAEGNVRVTRPDIRLVTHQLTYFVETRSFSCGPFRAGSGNIYAAGESFAGTLDEIVFSEVDVYFREPEPYSLGVEADTLSIRADQSYSAQGLRLQSRLLPPVPLPSYERDMDAPDVLLSFGAGYRGNLGAYIQTETSLPFRAHQQLGANLDLYSNRGVLLGPVYRNNQEFTDGYRQAEVNTGWILDQGGDDETGFDVNGEPIDDERYFIRAFWTEKRGPLQFTTRIALLSDSEIERDFREGIFEEEQQPDSFLQYDQEIGPILLTVFARYDLNDDFRVVERLPEVRLEQVLNPLGFGDINYFWQASYSHYRISQNSIPALDTYQERLSEEFVDRGDLLVGLERTIRLRPYLLFTGVASARYTAASKSLDTGVMASPGEPAIMADRETDRLMGQLGFDLRGLAHRRFSIQNKLWDIREITHNVQPVLQYRWTPGGDDLDHPFVPLDLAPYLSSLPPMDLADDRSVDFQVDLHRIRIGFENQVLATSFGGEHRELIELNLYQDLLLSDQNGEDRWDASYLQLRLDPAPWISLSWEAKVRSDGFDLEETHLRAELRSSDKWTAAFQVDYLDGRIQQYQAAGVYRLTEKWSLVSVLRYDADLNEFTRQQYGIRYRLGRTWETEIGASVRSGSTREDDVRLAIRLRLLQF